MIMLLKDFIDTHDDFDDFFISGMSYTFPMSDFNDCHLVTLEQKYVIFGDFNFDNLLKEDYVISHIYEHSYYIWKESKQFYIVRIDDSTISDDEIHNMDETIVEFYKSGMKLRDIFNFILL